MTTVKVKVLDRICDVTLPDGWRRVWDGALVPGDKYLHMLLFLDGITHWEPVVDFPTYRQMKDGAPYSSARWYACLIRRGHPVDEACEECEVEPKRFGHRYCEECCYEVAKRFRNGRSAKP